MTMPKSRRSRQIARWKFKLTTPIKLLLLVIGAGLLLAISGFTYAANRETQDSFCASCHTQPESTFYQRSKDATPVDMASAHTAKQTRCIDCHSGIGVFGRISAELLGAHNALAFYTGTAVQPATLTNPIGDGSCLKCHQNIADRRDMNNHFHFFLKRWQAVDPGAATCVSCHNGHNNTVSAQNSFMDVASVRVICESCHRAVGEGG